MKAIYKYELTETSPKINEILMVKGAKIIAFQSQPHTGLNLWATVPIPDQRPIPKRDEETGEVVTPAVETEIRLIEVVGTGWPFDDKDHAEYLGTAQDRHQMVWHAFEVVKSAPVVETPKGKK